LEAAQRPVIIAGVQVARFGLGMELMKFAVKANIPVATTPLSKSTVSETHPLALGVYASEGSPEHVRQIVEKSDCVMVLGAALSDTCGRVPVHFKRGCPEITCAVGQMRVKNHLYNRVVFVDLMRALCKKEITNKKNGNNWSKKFEHDDFKPENGAKITSKRLFDKINSILTPQTAIIADAGDSLFGAMNLVTHRHNHFLSPLYYGSKGFAIPGALGVQLAKPEVRPIVLVGDGAFKASCGELGTIGSLGLNPIVVILNNHGSAVRRLLVKDTGLCNECEWQYDKLAGMIPNSDGMRVETETELEEAFKKALPSNKLTIIHVVVPKDDISPALRRMTETHG
jgi:indolepyruvate decarboxylase